MSVSASAVRLLLLLLCISAVGALGQSPTTPPARAGSIEGHVTLAGKPMIGITVTLAPRVAQQREPFAESVTDETGRFKFDGVTPGSYVVDAFAPAFVAAGASLSNLERSKTVMVSEAEAVTGVEMALARGGVITGRIVDSNRQPIIDIIVELRQIDGSGRPLPRRISAYNQFMYRTDDRGVYRIYGLPAGRYKVYVGTATGAGAIQFLGGYYPRTFHPDIADEAKARIIELGEGEEVSNVDITVNPFEKTYDVSGQIVDASTGKPMGGLVYGYGAVSDAQQFVGTVARIETRSSPQGGFHIPGLPPGRYAAFVIDEGDSQYYCEPAVFDVTNSDVTGAQISLKRGASISGMIAFEGVDDVAAIADATKLNISASAAVPTLEAFRSKPVRINPDGRFFVSGLRPGKAIISVRGSIGGKNVVLSRIEQNGIEQQSIELRAGELLTGIRLVLSY